MQHFSLLTIFNLLIIFSEQARILLALTMRKSLHIPVLSMWGGKNMKNKCNDDLIMILFTCMFSYLRG